MGVGGSGVEGLTTGVLDFSLQETLTGALWIDGKPIFRRVITGPGGADLTTIVVAEFINLIDSLVKASWAALDGATTFRADRGLDGGINIDSTNGEVVAFHNSISLSGDTIRIILEYTKQ